MCGEGGALAEEKTAAGEAVAEGKGMHRDGLVFVDKFRLLCREGMEDNGKIGTLTVKGEKGGE